MNSFKLFDPTVASTNHHFEDSHARKAEHDHYSETLANTVQDLIHMGAIESGEEFDELSGDDLRTNIAV